MSPAVGGGFERKDKSPPLVPLPPRLAATWNPAACIPLITHNAAKQLPSFKHIKMLPALIVSKAVGFSTAPNPFDDVVDVGLWPAHEYVHKIIKIKVWVGANKINCIETTYRTSNGNPDIAKQHGTPVGNPFTIDLTVPNNNTKDAENQYFVGMFGSVDADDDAPILRRIGFLVYDRATGALTPFGPFPATETSGVKGFTSLGLIIGFSGTLATNNALETLAAYKLNPGGNAHGVSGVPANFRFL